MAPAEAERLLAAALPELSEVARRALAASAELLEVPPGAHVLNEGGEADALHVIVSGNVQLSVHQRHQDLPVATLGAGDLLGWSWLVPPHRWDFDAIAVAGATVLRVPAERLREVMDEDLEAAVALTGSMLAVLSRRLRDTRIQLLDLFSRDASGSRS